MHYQSKPQRGLLTTSLFIRGLSGLQLPLREHSATRGRLSTWVLTQYLSILADSSVPNGTTSAATMHTASYLRARNRARRMALKAVYWLTFNDVPRGSVVSSHAVTPRRSLPTSQST